MQQMRTTQLDNDIIKEGTNPAELEFDRLHKKWGNTEKRLKVNWLFRLKVWKK